MPAPFLPPLRTDHTPCAWRGGIWRRPTWARHRAALLLDPAGVHTLLRAAGLPREELLHMGATAYMLDHACGLLPEEHVARLLGRIIWDARHGEQGGVWPSHGVDKRRVLADGLTVIEHWFRPC